VGDIIAARPNYYAFSTRFETLKGFTNSRPALEQADNEGFSAALNDVESMQPFTI
jgi:hypothetical protein